MRRRGFTLVELMISAAIISIMAAMILVAAYSAQEMAKAAKTKALIAKLDSIIKSRWDAYRTRRVPVDLTPDQFTDMNGDGIWESGETLNLDHNGNGRYDPAPSPTQASVIRLTALRDLMRMEMPDRWTDISDAPATLPFSGGSVDRPSVSRGYLRRYSAGTPPSGTFASAECLYLIVMSAVAEEGDAREVFKPDDLADMDGDGFKEFIDGWGQPIKFLRWAPGLQTSELQIVARATASPAGSGQLLLTGFGLSSDPAAYAGGALFLANPGVPFDTIRDPSTGQIIVQNMMATITGYTPPDVSGNAFVTVTAPANMPTGKVAILAPDPFDVRGACVASSSSASPFALYPLIYSAGSNKCYGVCADFGGSPALSYISTQIPLNATAFGAGALANIDPFTVQTDNAVGRTSLIGACRDDPNEPNFVTNGWLDNIHNHALNQR